MSEEKDKGGRPRIELSKKHWEQIENLCSIQATAEEIASVMGFSVDTLERRIKERFDIGFAEYFKKHSGKGKASLRRTQFRLAEKNAAMAIFLGKNYLNQTDKFDGEIDLNIPQPIFKRKPDDK